LAAEQPMLTPQQKQQTDRRTDRRRQDTVNNDSTIKLARRPVLRLKHASSTKIEGHKSSTMLHSLRSLIRSALYTN